VSKSTWGVVVSVAFTIVVSVTPISERWRSVIVFIAWLLLLFSSVGWLLAHVPYLRNIRTGPKGKNPMTLIVVGVFGAAVAIAMWLLIVGKSTAPRQGVQTSPSPSAGPQIYFGAQSEVSIEDNILPDTARIGTGDRSKSQWLRNRFYQTTRPAQTTANPKEPNFAGKIWMVENNIIEGRN
jgi:hypothetical protein